MKFLIKQMVGLEFMKGVSKLDEMKNVLEEFKGAWPTIQPAISTVFGALVARLFLRGNTRKSEIEKLKQAKFSEIADKLLEGGHITHLEYYKCRNFNRIAQKADEVYQRKQASKIANTADEEKNFSIDWFVRFFEDSGNISDEKIQDLWAKVLAGEIEQPGSFSLRTLDVLRSLSKSEAETLQTIASYAIKIGNDYYISIDKTLQNQYGYSREMLTMYDCNIIENNIASHYDLTAHGAGVFMKIGLLACFANNQAAEKYSLDIQRFTKTGNELIRLVTPNEKYLLDFFRRIKMQFPNLNLTVHPVIEDNGDTFSYNKGILLI